MKTNLEDLQARLIQTHASFQAHMHNLAVVAGKTDLEIYALWREYADECQNWDQSPVLLEFVERSYKQMGGDKTALWDALKD